MGLGLEDTWTTVLEGDVFVTDCCVTSSHDLGGSKQHTFTISRSPWVRNPGTANVGPLFRV